MKENPENYGEKKLKDAKKNKIIKVSQEKSKHTCSKAHMYVYKVLHANL